MFSALLRSAKFRDGALVFHEITRALGLRPFQMGESTVALVAHEVPLRDVKGRFAELVALTLRVPVCGRRHYGVDVGASDVQRDDGPRPAAAPDVRGALLEQLVRFVGGNAGAHAGEVEPDHRVAVVLDLYRL